MPQSRRCENRREREEKAVKVIASASTSPLFVEEHHGHIAESRERTVDGVAFPVPASGRWTPPTPAASSRPAPDGRQGQGAVRRRSGRAGRGRRSAQSSRDHHRCRSLSTGVAERDAHSGRRTSRGGEVPRRHLHVDRPGARRRHDWRLRATSPSTASPARSRLRSSTTASAATPGAARAPSSPRRPGSTRGLGLTWNQALETGGWLVGKEIRSRSRSRRSCSRAEPRRPPAGLSRDAFPATLSRDAFPDDRRQAHRPAARSSSHPCRGILWVQL